MPFSFSGGLSEMGKSIANTAGQAALDMQRAALDEDRMKLADELAGKRESAARKETGLINQQAAAEDRAWRTTEAEKRETGENTRADIREKGEIARAEAMNTRMTNLSANEINAANARADADLKARVSLAKAELRTKEEQKIVDDIVKANTKKTPLVDKEGKPVVGSNDQPLYETTVNNVAVAAALRNSGHPQQANHFAPKAKEAGSAVAPPKPANLVGVKTQWNPALGVFRDADGKQYDKDGKPK